MSMSRLSKRGLILACLMLSLTACAGTAVRTKTVEVKVPVFVALPTEFFKPCMVPDPNNPKVLIEFNAAALPAPLTNGALALYVINMQTCLASSNDRLNRIRGLQPHEPNPTH